MAQQVQGVSALIDGNPTGFLAALRRAEGAAKDSSQRIGGAFSSIGDMFGGVQAKLAAFVGALGGGALFGRAISQTVEYTRSSMELGRALGTTAAEASTWLATLKDLDVGTDEFAGASRGLLTNLRNNEDQLRAYGLATRDANGQLKPFNELLLDAIEVVNGYAEGTDRNIAAQAIFGRSVSGNSRLLNLSREATEELTRYQRELGLVVGSRNVQAYEAYDSATDRVDLGMQGLSQVIADTLLPVLTSLAETLAQNLPNAIAKIRDNLGPLAARFVTVAFGVEAFAANAAAGFRNMGIAFEGFHAAKERALKFDFSGARLAIQQANSEIAANTLQLADRLKLRLKETQDLVTKLYQASAPDLSFMDPSAKSLDKWGRDKRAPDTGGSDGDSVMSKLQTQLEERKLAFERENAMREFSKAQELAYWKDVLKTVDLSQKDREAILLRGAKLEVEILRESAKQKAAIDGIRAESALAATMAEIEAAERKAEAEVAAGTRSRGSLLALQRQFNEERLVLELEFQDRKAALLAKDPERNAEALEQLEATKLEIKRRYAELGLEISNKEAKETAGKITNISQTIGQAFSQFANSFLTNWRGLGNALRSLLGSIGQSIISEVVLKPLQAEVAAYARKRLLALATIATNATKAASGAAASQASIPIVGPILAGTAMAAMLAAVGGLAAKVPSAAGGWDIPKGLNPLTQLHSGEMVLPQSLADTVRNMAAAGAMDTQRAPQPVEFKAERYGNFFLMREDHLVEALRKLNAQFKLRP